MTAISSVTESAFFLLCELTVSGLQQEMHKAERDQQDDSQDKLVLESVSGRKHNYDMKAPFYGDCRDVDDFKKLNRVGEGTYGVV